MFAIAIRIGTSVVITRTNSLGAAKTAFFAAQGDAVELHIGNRVAMRK